MQVRSTSEAVAAEQRTSWSAIACPCARAALKPLSQTAFATATYPALLSVVPLAMRLALMKAAKMATMRRALLM